MYVCLYSKVRADRGAPSARARAAHAEAAHDGAVRNHFSDRTIVCGLGVGPPGCCVTVHLCHVSRCRPAGLPAARGKST
eukprot:COSAG02_NODE_1549_length_11966_cov_3.777282_7_plen_79_part_00